MSREKSVPLGNDEILEILKLLNESKFDELRLETNGFKLVLLKGAAGVTQPAPDRSPVPVPPAPAPPPEPGGIADAPAAQASEGLVAVRSPILGIFYRAPQPGAPAFAELGSEVGAEDTVCLIEVMKLFHTVKAGVAGTIARICAENGTMVEHGQVLFFIAPAAAPEPPAA